MKSAAFSIKTVYLMLTFQNQQLLVIIITMYLIEFVLLFRFWTTLTHTKVRPTLISPPFTANSHHQDEENARCSGKQEGILQTVRYSSPSLARHNVKRSRNYCDGFSGPHSNASDLYFVSTCFESRMGELPLLAKNFPGFHQIRSPIRDSTFGTVIIASLQILSKQLCHQLC